MSVKLKSLVCKLMEGCIRDCILHHILENKLINPDQYRFLPNKSCTTQLLDTLNEWTQALEEGHSILVVFFDVEKAFESISHPHLVEQLQNFDLQSQLPNWVESFLKNRTQRVRVGDLFNLF